MLPPRECQSARAQNIDRVASAHKTEDEKYVGHAHGYFLCGVIPRLTATFVPPQANTYNFKTSFLCRHAIRFVISHRGSDRGAWSDRGTSDLPVREFSAVNRLLGWVTCSFLLPGWMDCFVSIFVFDEYIDFST